MIEWVVGSLLNSQEKYICHQTNCISTSSSGIAASIFVKFPHADIYSKRSGKDKPGEIVICGDGANNRFVINLHGQNYPGSHKPSGPDAKEMRQQYFHQGLSKIAKIKDLESIAFPAGIGCGLAGGDWEFYFKTLTVFEKHVNDKYGTKVCMYRLESDKQWI